MCKRSGFTVLELLIVIAIIGVLVGLLLPAIMRVRETAVKAHSQNNLKQIIMATHHFSDSHNTLLPDIDGSSAGPNIGDSVFCALLPYIEQGKAYDSLNTQPVTPVVKTYMSSCRPNPFVGPGKLLSM